MWMCEDNNSATPNCGICPQCRRNIEVLKNWVDDMQDKLDALGISRFFGWGK